MDRIIPSKNVRLMENKEIDNNDVFANNRGVIKSPKGLILAIVGIAGFIGYIILLGVLSTMPSYQWMTVALTGLLFFVAGIIFMAVSKNSYNLPLFAMTIGVILLYLSVTERFFPDVREGLGDKGPGGILIAFGILMLLFPFIATAYYKSKYKVTVYAEVIHVEHHFSRTSKGHHAITYRPIYVFTYSGQEYTVTDKVFKSGKHPSTGEERKLLIDERKPERFVDIERMKERSVSSYVAPVIIIALGIYLMVAG